MNIAGLIKPLGISTYVFVLVALASGRFRAKLHLKLAHHKRLALAALILATIHAALVLIVY
jgi:hypothetical protein